MKLIPLVFCCLRYLICNPIVELPQEQERQSSVVTGDVSADTTFTNSRVFAINYLTDRVYDAQMSSDSTFILDGIPAGTYTFYAQAPFFENDTIGNVALDSDDSLSLSFHLRCSNTQTPYTYSYYSNVQWDSLVLDQFKESDSENINFSQPGEVSLEIKRAQSKLEGPEFFQNGVLTSSIMSFQEYPLEAYMSWSESISPYGSDREISIEFRIRSITDDGQAAPWSELIESPVNVNIEPFLDGESKMFQYEMTLRTEDPFLTPVVSSMQVDYRFETLPRLIETSPPSRIPRF